MMTIDRATEKSRNNTGKHAYIIISSLCFIYRSRGTSTARLYCTVPGVPGVVVCVFEIPVGQVGAFFLMPRERIEQFEI